MGLAAPQPVESGCACGVRPGQSPGPGCLSPTPHEERVFCRPLTTAPLPVALHLPGPRDHQPCDFQEFLVPSYCRTGAPERDGGSGGMSFSCPLASGSERARHCIMCTSTWWERQGAAPTPAWGHGRDMLDTSALTSAIQLLF